MIGIQEIREAQKKIGGQVVHTPCIRSHFLSNRYQANIFLKLENFQCTGSFKERGALNCLLSLTPEQRALGVVTASAGNHAQAVAYHASRLGIKSTVFMPKTTPALKVSRTEGFGAAVQLVGQDYDDAFDHASVYAQQQGAYYLHAYNNNHVIAGQGTIGLELLQQVPELDLCIIAVGGGGLAAGVGTALKDANSSIGIIGVEPTNNASMALAFASGKPESVPPAKTIADGIAVRRAGNFTYEICAAVMDELHTVNDDEIADAMADLWEMQKILVEGAGAAAVAILDAKREKIRGKTVCAIIGGGNVDNSLLLKIVERRLVKTGRLVCLEVIIFAEPSSFSQLSQLLAQQSINIVNMHRKYTCLKGAISQEIIEVTVMARCGADVTQLLSTLRSSGFQVGEQLSEQSYVK